VPISAVVGNPLSGALLTLPPMLGLASWRWLFLIEGLPAVLLGLYALAKLRNAPADAEWLDAADKRLLSQALSEDDRPQLGQPEVGSVLRYAGLLALFSVANLGNALGLYATFIWMPGIVKSLGALTNLQTGFVSAVPFVFAMAALVLCARSSDRLGERKWHNVAMLVISGLAMAVIAFTPSPAARLLLLTIAMSCAIGAQATLFAMFIEALRLALPGTKALAGGLATITTVGNIGGFAGATLVGLILSGPAGYRGVLFLIAGAFVFAGLLVAPLRASFLTVSPREI
jgi:ACS family tartrate transporter-like MFS transporter